MQQPASRHSATRPGSGSTGRWCGQASRGCRWASCRAGSSIPGSTLSHHLKTLIIVGLVTQERDATTLICRANYPVMRGLVDFLVAECCTEAGCASIKPAATAA